MSLLLFRPLFHQSPKVKAFFFSFPHARFSSFTHLPDGCTKGVTYFFVFSSSARAIEKERSTVRWAARRLLLVGQVFGHLWRKKKRNCAKTSLSHATSGFLSCSRFFFAQACRLNLSAHLQEELCFPTCKEAGKKKKGGLPEAFPGNSLVLFFSSISVVCHSSFIVHALTFRKFTIRSRSHHHDTITFHVQYAQHPPLPCPSPTHHNLLLFCLVLPSTVLRGHIFCVRAPFLRRKKKKTALWVDTTLPRLAPYGKRKSIW